MQAALDFAAYALGATMLVGVLLLGMLAHDLWFGNRFREPHPEYVRLPCTALDAARDVYGHMKSAYVSVSPRERRLLDVHLRRMEERVQMLEEKVFDEQAPYYKAVARREKLWRGSKALFDQVRHMSRANRKRAHHLLQEAAATYRMASEGVKEEYERGVRRDKFMLDDLRALGVLDETYLPKLLDQVKAHAARMQAGPEALAWQEPGTEDAELANPQAPPAAEVVAASAAGLPDETLPAADAKVPPARIGSTAYDRIREALAPMFGRKAAPPELQPVPVEAPTIPASAWKPAPPPPQVDLPPPHAPKPIPVVPLDPASSFAGSPGLLRQQDFSGDGLMAADRSYTEPTFALSALPRGILRQADLSRTKFNGVRFTGRHRYLDCRFADADLKGIHLESQGRPHQFVRCNFQGAQFDASRIGFALFHECNLTNTRWTGARLERVRFSDCVMDGVDWGGTDLVETRVVSMDKPTPAAVPVIATQDEVGPVAVAAPPENAEQAVTATPESAAASPTEHSNTAVPPTEAETHPLPPPGVGG